MINVCTKFEVSIYLLQRQERQCKIEKMGWFLAVRGPQGHWMVGWLEFNVAFQHKYSYIRDERSLEIAPFDKEHTSSYQPSLVTTLFLRYGKILQENDQFFTTPPASPH